MEQNLQETTTNMKTVSGELGTAVKRMELIFSAAIEEDIFESFKEKQIGAKYTKIPAVMGAGCSNPKLGDAIWPQLNVYVVIYCSEEEAAKIVDVVQDVRKRYPVEGVACFESDAIVR